MQDIWKIEDGKVFLMDKLGKKGPCWNTKPEVCSGIFVVHTSDEGDTIYTILGTPVKNSLCKKVIVIINFWVYYVDLEGNHKVARLEAIGLNYKFKIDLQVEDFGLLAYKGCTLKIDGVWRIYNYGFGALSEDLTKPNVVIQETKIESHLRKGFSLNYLKYLANENGDRFPRGDWDEKECYKKANADFLQVVSKICDSADNFTPEQLGNLLGLQPYIVGVITNIAKIREMNSLIQP